MADKIEMTPTEYEALLSWARVGAEAREELDTFLGLRVRLDRAHGLMRFVLHIRYTPLPERFVGVVPGAPREDMKTLELTRPPTINDVRLALGDTPHHDSMVLVTTDPTATVGWYDLEHFPW